MTKTASLTSGLVTKISKEIRKAKKHPKEKYSFEYFKSLTVKLDKDRYMALKKYGLEEGLSSQEIFVLALDKYLK